MSDFQLSVFSKKLNIAHCLYRGAYSGLCCGNVYRDKGQSDETNDRYELGDKVLPIIHGHSYNIKVLFVEESESDGKQIKDMLDTYFEKYQNSMILTADNPLSKVSFEESSKLIIWDENPTAEYMARYWYDALSDKISELSGLSRVHFVSVEETSHNKVAYNKDGYHIITSFEIPVAYEIEGKSLRTLTGENAFVETTITSKELDKNKMVIDFKKMKKILHSVFDKYDHSLLLTEDSPLIAVYKTNFEQNNIDFDRSRLFVLKSSSYLKDPDIRLLFQLQLQQEVSEAFDDESDNFKVNVQLKGLTY